MSGHATDGEVAERVGRDVDAADNLRATLDRLASLGDTQRSLALSGALTHYWIRSLNPGEGRRRLEDALSADDNPTQARARALTGASMVAMACGDAAARRLAGDGLALQRTLTDPIETARALWALGAALSLGVDGTTDDAVAAVPLLEEALLILRGAGEEHMAGMVRRTLAATCVGTGEVDRAVQLHEENLRAARETGDRRLEGVSLGALALLTLDRDEPERTMTMLGEAYVIFCKLDSRDQLLDHLSRYTFAHAYLEHGATAVKLAAAARVLREDAGYHLHWVEELVDEALELARSQLDEAAFAEANEQGRTLTLDGAYALALAELS